MRVREQQARKVDRKDLGFQQNEWTRQSLDKDLEEVKVDSYLEHSCPQSQQGRGSHGDEDSYSVGTESELGRRWTHRPE